MSVPPLAPEPSALSPTLSTASESAFPLEIYERILDFVAEDVKRRVWKRTLASTSLVCHGWHPRSRALLFRVLRFGVGDEETLRRIREHFVVAPHLAAYVEEVRLIHSPKFCRILESFPRWLAVSLPRLRAVFVLVDTSAFHLNMHRFFCLPGARVRSVRSLEYENIHLLNTSELEGLLIPYPNARVLTLHRVSWYNRAHTWTSKRLPRPLHVTLALTELRYLFDTINQNCLHIFNRLGLEYLLQACKATLSKLLLNIPPVRILTLQLQDDHPLHVIELPYLDVLHIEVFASPRFETLLEDEKDGSILSYLEVVSSIPRLLRRLNAVRLRILRLSFSVLDIDEAPDAFLESLRAMHDAMEDMILASCFPSLKAITLDLGYRARNIPAWQSRVTKCFPKLEKVVCIQVIPYDTLSEDIRSNMRSGFYY